MSRAASAAKRGWPCFAASAATSRPYANKASNCSRHSNTPFQVIPFFPLFPDPTEWLQNIADQFYQTMEKNALYLDLVAKELFIAGSIAPEELIGRIAHNPENIFSLSMARLKRQPVEWREVIKPVLEVLLAALEPLSRWQIRQLIHVDDDRLRDGIARLGGLLAETAQHKYTLFHLKLQDYLRQDEDHPQKEYIFATDEVEHW